ncbi:MAG: 2TM domain-containing protein [Flavobacterium sp.]
MENISQIEIEKYNRAKKRVESIRGFYSHLLVYIVINIMLLVVFAQNKTLETFLSFRTFSTAISWGIGLIAHALGVFGYNLFLGKEWEDRKMKELIEKYKQ